MGYNHNRIKENARAFYKNNTGSSIVALLILFGVSVGATLLIEIIIGIFAAIGVAFDTEALIIFFYYIAIIALSLALLPLYIGFFGWFRKSIFQKTSLGEMFAPYQNGRFWSSVGTIFLMQLYTFLWSLLFIIPGFIKSLSYSQTYFIKDENPNIPAKRAIELSEIMMNGHKGDLFYLYISFLGWMILSSFTYHILGIVYVFPYFYSALSFAYIEIKEDAIARGVVDAYEFEYVGVDQSYLQ